MGRILLQFFLFTVVFGAVSIAVAIGDALAALLRMVITQIDPPLIPFGTAGVGAFLTVSAVYFFIVLPIVVGLVVAFGPGRDLHREPAARPELLDWKARKAAVVLTAYDDEQAIGPAVDEFRALPEVAEVIVVDNNSRDGTAEVARRHGATVLHETRQGYGFACMGGLRKALDESSAEIIVLAEGDMTFFASDLEKMLPYLSECDMVLGTRTTKTLTHAGSQMDWFMAWGNLFLAFLIRLRYWDRTFLGRMRLTDVGCTFRVIRRDALRRILGDLTVGGNYFSPHMILMALRNGLTVVEVPIRFRRRVGLSKGAGSSRGRAIRIGFEMVREISLH